MPAINITKSTPTRIGKGSTKIPNFEIVKWVDRPAELNGEEAVSAAPEVKAEPTPAPAKENVFADDEI